MPLVEQIFHIPHHPVNLSSPLVRCRVRVVQSFVFCAVIYISQFVLLSVSLWSWYCVSFVSFLLAMILSGFCHFTFGHDIVCLFRCKASGYLFDIFKSFLHSCDIVICPLSVFKVSINGLYFPTIYAFIAY